jgi:small GTP-binding protein
MGYTSKEWLETILGEMIRRIVGIKAVAVVLRNGLIVHSIIKDIYAQDDIIGSVTAMFDIFITRFKKDYGSTNSFFSVLKRETDKLYFANAGKNSILTIIGEPDAEDDRIKVYALYIGTKLAQFFEGDPVDPVIPEIIHVLSKMRSGQLPAGRFSVKMILIGEPGAGKTSLIKNLREGTKLIPYLATMGFQITTASFMLGDTCQFDLNLWDMGRILRRTPDFFTKFYSGTDVALICVDITRRKDFDAIDNYHREICSKLPSTVPVVLVATKCDLKNQAILESELATKALQLHAEYFFTSVVSEMNILALFEYCSLKYLETKFGASS